ncbi:SDR family oxidoreductase [Streptomyces sp. NPDC050560]|uniref:SDR family oxidoreductase n=1 Tax=Streptomyces sp. NPDC050560 TaxID=3365630 RepID=UPI0037A9C67C
MSVLITGATGFVGSRVLRYLLAGGGDTPVVALGRDQDGLLRRRIEAAVRWAPGPPLPPYAFDALRCFHADLGLPGLGLGAQERAAAASGATAIWHCAGSPNLHGDPGPVYRANVLGTRRVIELADEAPGARLVHVSTAYVAGRRHRGHVLEDDLSGEAGFQVYYEESKYLAERMVRAWAAGGRAATVLRPSLMVEDRPVPPGLPQQPLGVLGRFVALSLRGAGSGAARALGLRLRVPGDPDGALNLVGADYATRAMVAAAAAGTGPGVRTLHVTHPRNTPVHLLTRAIETAYRGVSVRVLPEVPRPTSREARVAEEFATLLAYTAQRRTYDRTHLRCDVPELDEPPAIDTECLAAALGVLDGGSAKRGGRRAAAARGEAVTGIEPA